MEYRLEEIFDLQMGKTPSRNNPNYWNTEDNKWISIADLSKCGKYIETTKEYLSDTAVEESGISCIPENTVVMSFKLSIGKTAITSEAMYSNEAIMSFRDRKVVEILPDYIYYLFSYKDWDEGTNKAVMGKTLNKATLSKVKVNIPDFETQRNVVETLDKVSKIISDRRMELEKLDELIKSRFIEMFGNPDANEKGWGKSKLENHINVVGGYAFKSQKYLSEGIPVLRIGNINAGYFRDTNLVFYQEDEALEKYKIYPNDLVLSLTGTAGKDDYGNICLMDSTYDVYYLNQRNAKIEIKHSFDRLFLMHLFSHPEIKQRLTGKNHGIRQGNILNKDILELNVYIPPIELQNEFADFVKLIDKLKFTVQKSLDETQTLMDSLMQQYFG